MRINSKGVYGNESEVNEKKTRHVMVLYIILISKGSTCFQREDVRVVVERSIGGGDG